MLDFYFDSPGRLRRLRQGPLAEHLDVIASEFQQRFYARNTARRTLSVIGQFNNYIRLLGVAVEDINEVVTSKFVEEMAAAGASAAMRCLLDYLRRCDIIASVPAPPPHPFESLLEGFDCYLRDVRGLSSSTRRMNKTSARIMIDWLRSRYAEEALVRLGGPDVLEFISDRLDQYTSRSSRGHVCSNVRAFLRYLHAAGTIPIDLTPIVPRISMPRLASLPRALPWEQVRALIDGIDTNHPDGLRDKAMLLLLAMLGLRSGELRSLEFNHVHWKTGELHLPCTKSRRERVLPLVQEVGSSLADYVLHGRPVVEVPQIFLHHRTQPGPITHANTVVYIVRRHLKRAGIHHCRAGAHMLRHSLATRLVNTGVPIKSVADVLGHASIDTTAIYTKVDTSTLATVALPFPGGQ